ncbi:acetyl-CoA synthetase-like protein [Xylariaceae sp. FL0255]|nr:acetyl-CoA synthetase-like protein [Xylariaceae sp. FL0255]
MVRSTVNGRFGRRLLPHVVYGLALEKPEKEYGWRAISFKTYANAIDALAQSIIDAFSQPSLNSVPTLTYIGPNDARYVVVFVAAMKAGYKALFVSPRNSFEAQMNLFEATDCQLICFPASHRAIVQPWLQAREMRAMEMECADVPYKKTFEEIEKLPAVVLHTSGSTGLPKPFIAMHGVLAAFDAYHDLQTGTDVGLSPNYGGFSNIFKLFFIIIPFFHAGGIFLFMSRAIYWGNSIALGIPDRPLSPDLILSCLRNVDVKAALIPRIILEYLSQSEPAIQVLKSLDMVISVAVDDLATHVRNKLVDERIFLVNAIAATEYCLFTNYVAKSPDLWRWFLIDSEIVGIDWRLVDGYNDVYRLVFVRKHTPPAFQSWFYALPDAQEFETKDLFRKHPTLRYKLNPVKTEELIERHPAVKGALVVGSGRFPTALLIEPARSLAGEEQKNELIETLWPTIVVANEKCESHGRIEKMLFFFTVPDRPLPRGGKGTIQRANAVHLYKHEIDPLYTSTEKTGAESGQDFPVILTFDTQLAPKTPFKLDTDFYTAGVDSLQVIGICHRLRNSFVACGLEKVAAIVNIGLIYKCQTLRRLGGYLFPLAAKDGTPSAAFNTNNETSAMELAWKKYTGSPPNSTPQRAGAATEGRTVILTGSTGMLDTKVGHIHCFNRAGYGGLEQQKKATALRGLSNNFEKCTYHYANTSQQDFALGSQLYKRLLRETDSIFLSFEPYIHGIRNAAEFASRSRKRTEDITRSTVPETRIEDLSLPNTRYGRSKLVASLVLEDIAQACVFPATIIRIGQVVGPDVEEHIGSWNKHEWLPSIIASSLHLKAMPEDLGHKNSVDWLPVERAVDLILDVASQSGYFHGVNQDRVAEILDFKTWVAGLEESESDGPGALEKNPRLKLLDLNRAIAAASSYDNDALVFFTTRTSDASPSLHHATAITTQVMMRWCAQWDF